jgi:hypothetical protein
MDLFGYDIDYREADDPTLRRLGEATIEPRDLAELRRIVGFLSEVLGQLEARYDPAAEPTPYTNLFPGWHLHFRDWDEQWTEGSGDLIVSLPVS